MLLLSADASKILEKSFEGLNAAQILAKTSTMGLTEELQLELIELYATDAENYKTVASLNALSASEEVATATTSNLGLAFQGLAAKIGISTTALGLLTAGIAAVAASVLIWKNYQEQLNEAVQASTESGAEFRETTNSITEQIEKVKELRSKLADSNTTEAEASSIKQELLGIQDSLVDKYGKEAEKINLVNGELEDQISLLQGLSKEKANAYLNDSENLKGFEESKKQLNKVRRFNLATVTDENILDVAREFEDRGIELEGTYSGTTIKINADAEEAKEVIEDINERLRELQNESDEETSKAIQKFLNSSSEAYSKADEIVATHKQNYLDGLYAKMYSNGNDFGSPADVYEQYTDAINEYNEALKTGEGIDKAKKKYESVKDSVSSVEKEYKDFIPLFEELESLLDKDAIDLQNFTDKLSEGSSSKIKKYADKIKSLGLSSDDLRAFNPNDDMEEKGEKTFNKLSKEAEKYGLTIDELISLLEKLGYVQGEVTSKNEEVSSIPSTEELEEQINNFNSAIDEIQSTYDTLSSAVEEYNSQGFLSLDTLQSLMSLSDEYLACLVNENGQLSLNSDMLNTLTQAKLAEAEATAIDQAIKELDTIATTDATTATANYITGNANLMQSLALLAGQYDNVANAAMTAAQAQSLSASIESANAKNSAATANVMAGLNTKLSLIRSTSSSISKRGIGNVSKKSSNSGSSTAKKTMEDIQKQWKEYLDKYLAMYKAELDAGLINFNTFLNKSRSLLDEFYRDGKISAKDYWDSIKELNESQLSIYDKVLSAVTRRIEKEVDGIQDIIQGLEKQNDVLQKQLDKYNSILAAVEEVYDNRIQVLNKQKEAIQDNIQKLQDENDEHNRALELEKAKWNLYKAMNNRTKRVFNGTEFVYQTDRDEVREAQKNLQDLTLEQTISAMEKEIGLLEDQIEVLEEFKSKWSDISDAYEKEVNRQNAILLWGREYEKMILSNRLSDIDSFKNSYISIQQQIDDNEGLIESYNEKVDYYNKLKEQWSDISKAYEQSQEDQYASMLLGAQWESDVLSGRIDVLNNFKNQYIAIQQAITNAALEAARAQANAQSIQASSASSGGGGSSYSGGSSNSGNAKVLQLQHFMNQVFGSNLTEDGIMGSKTKEAIKHMQLLIGASQTGVYDKATYDKLKYYVGKTLRENNKTLYNIAKSLGYPAYAKGTTNAKKGVALVSEEEHGDEIIIDNKDNAYVAEGEQLHYFEGGETVIKASESEKILANMENLTPLQDYVSPFSGLNLQPIDYSSMVMSSLNLPDFSKLTVKNNTTPVVQNITMTLPNVTNESGYEKITKELKQAQLDAMQFAHRR